MTTYLIWGIVSFKTLNMEQPSRINFLTSTSDKLANYDSSGKLLGLTGKSHQGGAYSHPIRTYALCEAYTMTKIPKLKEFAKRAAKVIVDGQNPNGGWAYKFGQGIGAHVDLSITGWCIQALKAFALTGITDVSVDDAMDKAIEYVKKCQDSAEGLNTKWRWYR